MQQHEIDSFDFFKVRNSKLTLNYSKKSAELDFCVRIAPSFRPKDFNAVHDNETIICKFVGDIYHDMKTK